MNQEQVGSSITSLNLSKITLDREIQPRTYLNETVIAEYSEAMQRGANFPAITVFYDGSRYWLADGFHRFYAKQLDDQLKILVEIKFGSRRDAILFAAGTNTTHGFQRTNTDKHRVVERLLLDSEWGQMSDNMISQLCSVSQPFVSKVRQQFSSTYNRLKSSSRRGADGRIINTSNIGPGKKVSKAKSKSSKQVGRA